MPTSPSMVISLTINCLILLTSHFSEELRDAVNQVDSSVSSTSAPSPAASADWLDTYAPLAIQYKELPDMRGANLTYTYTMMQSRRSCRRLIHTAAPRNSPPRASLTSKTTEAFSSACLMKH